MKKCKYCQSDIDVKAKVCPICKKRLNTTSVIFRVLIGSFIAFIGIIMAVSSFADYASDVGGDSNSGTSTTSKQEQEYATFEKFEKVQNGMTYDEVVQIMGYDGTLMSDVGDDTYNIKMYYWYGKDGVSNTTISFDNGKVSGKSQIGLK